VAVRAAAVVHAEANLLDENNIQLGILNPTGDNGASFQNGIQRRRGQRDEPLGRGEWLIEPRLKGSIVVPRTPMPPWPRSSAGPAIRASSGADGDPHRQPPGRNVRKIYEAAAAAGLPIGVHAFGFGGYPVTGSGWPSFTSRYGRPRAIGAVLPHQA
jgi:hypothetical protein